MLQKWGSLFRGVKHQDSSWIVLKILLCRLNWMLEIVKILFFHQSTFRTLPNPLKSATWTAHPYFNISKSFFVWLVMIFKHFFAINKYFFLFFVCVLNKKKRWNVKNGWKPQWKMRMIWNEQKKIVQEVKWNNNDTALWLLFYAMIVQWMGILTDERFIWKVVN